MTLAEKLERLRLPTMSRQLDQALQHAAEKSLSPAAALEWLTDLELEAQRPRCAAAETSGQIPSRGRSGVAGSVAVHATPKYVPCGRIFCARML